MAAARRQKQPKSSMTAQQCQVDEEGSPLHVVDTGVPRSMPKASVSLDRTFPWSSSEPSSITVGTTLPPETTSHYELSLPIGAQRRRKHRRRMIAKEGISHSEENESLQLKLGQTSIMSEGSSYDEHSQQILDHSHDTPHVHEGIGDQFNEVPNMDSLHGSLARTDHLRIPIVPGSSKLSLTDPIPAQGRQDLSVLQRFFSSLDPNRYEASLARVVASFDPESIGRICQDHHDAFEPDLGDQVDHVLQKKVEAMLWQFILPIMHQAWVNGGVGISTAPVGMAPQDTSPGTTKAMSDGDVVAGCGLPTAVRKGGIDRQTTEDQDEQDDANGSGSGGSGTSKTMALIGMEHHELACHYNLCNPNRFCRGSEHGAKYQSCTRSFKNTAAIIQHFRERHYYNDTVCVRCLKQFSTKRDLQRHLRSDSICTLQERHSIEDEMPLLPGTDRRKRLEKLGKRKVGVSNEDQWCRIWNALFPEIQSPSPYRKLDSLEKAYDCAVSTYIPSLVDELVSIYPELEREIAILHCRRATDAIREQLWPSFESGLDRARALDHTANLPPSRNLHEDSATIASLTDGSTMSVNPFDSLGSDGSHDFTAISPLEVQIQAPWEVHVLFDAVDYHAPTIRQLSPLEDIGHDLHTGDTQACDWMIDVPAVAPECCTRVAAVDTHSTVEVPGQNNGKPFSLPDGG